MKRKILVGWIILHLLFIVLVNITGVYSIYCDFYNRKPVFLPAVATGRLLRTAPFNYYGRYTGAASGYGFFGINVRSNGLLIGECNGQKLSPEFNSYETSLRFFSMSGTVTDNWLKPAALKDSNQNYNNLVLKNIAVTLFQKNNCADTSVTLSYNLLQFPSLAEIKKGVPEKYNLLKLVTMRYGIH